MMIKNKDGYNWKSSLLIIRICIGPVSDWGILSVYSVIWCLKANDHQCSGKAGATFTCQIGAGFSRFFMALWKVKMLECQMSMVVTDCFAECSGLLPLLVERLKRFPHVHWAEGGGQGECSVSIKTSGESECQTCSNGADCGHLKQKVPPPPHTHSLQPIPSLPLVPISSLCKRPDMHRLFLIKVK